MWVDKELSHDLLDRVELNMAAKKSEEYSAGQEMGIWEGVRRKLRAPGKLPQLASDQSGFSSTPHFSMLNFQF